MPLSHEKQPLLLKVYEEKPPRRFTIKTFPPPEPLSERQIEPIPPISLPPCSTSPETPPYPPPRNSPIKGEIKFGGGRGGVVKQDEEETIINTLVFGEYDSLSLSDMATDINGGQKSDIVKKILYKQMRILLREDLKSLLKNNSLIKNIYYKQMLY